MPRYREIYNQNLSKIIVWKITETEEELTSLVNDNKVLDIVLQYKSLSHRKQYLVTNILLEQEHCNHLMTKDENGKPILPEGFISISHDSNFVAIMLSSEKCGLDLQSESPKVMRIQHKFYDEDDANKIGAEIPFYTLIWSLKEALYKINGDPMVFFKEHIRISEIKGNRIKASILHEKYLENFELMVKNVDELILTFTV